jgi:hypothetical protein
MNDTNKTYTLPEIMDGQSIGLTFRLDTVTVGPVTLTEGQYRTELISENYGMIGIVTGNAETVLTCEAHGGRE